MNIVTTATSLYNKVQGILFLVKWCNSMEKQKIRSSDLALIFQSVRLYLNLSIQEVSLLTGISCLEIEDIEKGNLTLPVTHYLKLCEIYRIPLFEEFDIIL